MVLNSHFKCIEIQLSKDYKKPLVEAEMRVSFVVIYNIRTMSMPLSTLSRSVLYTDNPSHTEDFSYLPLATNLCWLIPSNRRHNPDSLSRNKAVSHI